jgi:DNA-binding HxlR family transcriptional regulator
LKQLKKSFGCPVELSLEILGGKWKAVILSRLKARPLRYGELRQMIPALSDKMLSQRLKDLERQGLVATGPDMADSRRRAYRLTRRGESLRPVLQALYDWGAQTAGDLNVEIRKSPTPNSASRNSALHQKLIQRT